MRHAFVLLATFVAIGSAAAQTSTVVQQGELVRLTTRAVASDSSYLRGGQVVGPLSGYHGDTVFLAPYQGAGRARWYPASTIEHVERSSGRYHPYGRSALLGTMTMGGLGIVGGFLYHAIQAEPTKNCGPVVTINGQPFQTCHALKSKLGHELTVSVSSGVVVGLVTGLLYGGHVTREHWSEVDIHTLAAGH